MTEALRAGESRRLYWFTDSGIVRVQSISFAILLCAFVILTFAVSLGFFLFAATSIQSFTPILVALGVLFVIAVPIGFLFLFPEVIRNGLLHEPLESLMKRNGTVIIPWNEVVRVQSNNGGIVVWTSEKRYFMWTRKNHLEIQRFLVAKIGDRLQIQDS
jgi:hypothetical protein